MRTHILLAAVFGLAVSGCGTCQPALESCGGTGDNQPQEQFTSDCIPYAVIQTNDDGSFMIRYQTVELVPRQRTFIDANGQEIVCTEMQRSYVEHTSTVAPGTDISEYLKVQAGGGTLDQEPDLHFNEYVDPAPAPPAPADAVILPELQVVTSIAASQSVDRALE